MSLIIWENIYLNFVKNLISFIAISKFFSENNSPEEIENYVFIIESFLATLEILFECLGIDAVDSM